MSVSTILFGRISDSRECTHALQITHGVLVELEDAPVRHADTVALILSKIAPAATLIVLQARTKRT